MFLLHNFICLRCICINLHASHITKLPKRLFLRRSSCCSTSCHLCPPAPSQLWLPVHKAARSCRGLWSEPEVQVCLEQGEERMRGGVCLSLQQFPKLKPMLSSAPAHTSHLCLEKKQPAAGNHGLAVSTMWWLGLEPRRHCSMNE